LSADALRVAQADLIDFGLSRVRVSRLVRAFDRTRRRREMSVCERRSAVSACSSFPSVVERPVSPSAIGGTGPSPRACRGESSPKPGSLSATGDFRISASAAFAGLDAPGDLDLALASQSDTAPISRR
jgi:hypothetical protein